MEIKKGRHHSLLAQNETQSFSYTVGRSFKIIHIPWTTIWLFLTKSFLICALKTERELEKPLSHQSTPKTSIMARTCQAKVRHWELNPDASHGWQGPNYCSQALPWQEAGVRNQSLGLALDPGTTNMGPKHLNPCLNH